MKNASIILLLFVSYFSTAQTVAVELSEINLLYRGLDNPLKVAISDTKPENTVVKTSEGLKLKVENGNYAIFCMKDAKPQEYVYVGRLLKKDTVWVDTFAYRVRSMPQPYAQLGQILNDGLPKLQAQITAQTHVIATFHSGFSYNLEYKVLSYRLIIAFKDRPPYAENGVSDSLTPTMLAQLAQTYNGDRILIEGIRAVESKYGFKANLSPILINIRNKKPNSLHQNKELVYTRIEKPNGESYTFTNTEFELTQEGVDSIQNGTINYYFTTDSGFFRETQVIKNGVITEKLYFNDEGKKLYQLTKNEDVWQFEEYYKNGKLKTKTTVSDSLTYVGNIEILECDNYFLGHCYGQSYYERCKQIIHQSDESDVHQIKYQYNLSPIGDVRIYHPNGNVKMTGKLVYGLRHKTEANQKNGAFEGFQNSNPGFNDISVLDGIWTFYNEDGSVAKTRVYKLGERVE
jgi:antitoxin component YwqK of YwqJK toxin-antitoxin module